MTSRTVQVVRVSFRSSVPVDRVDKKYRLLDLLLTGSTGPLLFDETIHLDHKVKWTEVPLYATTASVCICGIPVSVK